MGVVHEIQVGQKTIRVRTHYEHPPIPLRDMDWTAIDDRTFDGPGCVIGYGATEQEAIDDLVEQLDD